MPSSPRPLVGVSACVREINTLPFHAVNERYLVALADRAGALPIVIPALGDKLDLDDVVERLDGLLVTGSPSNVEPHLYGSTRARDDILHDPARDSTTLPLLRRCVAAGVPVLAICRGIQELNVALGGTLHQFLHEVPGKVDHRSDKTKPIGERAGPAHPVALSPDGLLARLAGSTEAVVNSLHGQGIDKLGEGLVVEAMAPDGTIEAVRVANAKSFAVGVQFHPECLCDRDPLCHALFVAFGDAARERAARRRSGLAAAA